MHVHKPKAPEGWRDFLKEIGVIVIGILIALAGEQLVESAHRGHLAREARGQIQSELRQNLQRIKSNRARLVAQERQLEDNLTHLQSDVPDDQIIRALRYVWALDKNQNSAWTAAKLNGSLALIQSKDVAQASYVYDSDEASDPIAYGYFADMDTAAAIVDHARADGRLTPPMRERLIVATAAAAGRVRTLIKLLGYEQVALEASPLLSQ
jgi:hypothetical protein